jgi:hypothetical protein
MIINTNTNETAQPFLNHKVMFVCECDVTEDKHDLQFNQSVASPTENMNLYGAC